MNTELAVQPSEALPSADLARRLDELRDTWAAHLAADFSETTKDAYLKALDKFAGWLADSGLTLATAQPADVRAWREELRAEYAVATVNLWLTAVRRFYAWLIEEGAPILNPASIPGASRRGQSTRHKRDELTAAEVRGVLATCENTPTGNRDAAVLALMAYCALRTVEVQRADLAELQTRDGRAILWIQGKGHAEADDFVVLPPPAEELVNAWLADRGAEPGPLILSVGRRNKGERLSLRHLRRIVKTRYQAAGVVGDRKTTHSLRHSAISSAIRNGAEPLQVQAMARHRSFDTTLAYYHEIGRTEKPAEDLISYAEAA